MGYQSARDIIETNGGKLTWWGKTLLLFSADDGVEWIGYISRVGNGWQWHFARTPIVNVSLVVPDLSDGLRRVLTGLVPEGD